MEQCRPISTPLAKGEKLSKKMAPSSIDEINEMKTKPYAQAVGSLMYAMLCTRPDLCYVVGLVSRYQSNPGIAHWLAVKRIMRYVQQTKAYKLTYQSKSFVPQGYCDADFAGDLDERKSTSGYVFTLGGGAISWSSKKQGCVARSTMEAEFISCSAAASEAVWVKGFLANLNIRELLDEPINIRCDNQAAISTIKNGEVSARTKHIELQYFYIFDVLQKDKITVSYISTKEMVADPLTKAIATDEFRKHVFSMGLQQ
ncbi:gibberellin 2beta-dioxygenase [Ranunculus cassubicifolius]